VLATSQDENAKKTAGDYIAKQKVFVKNKCLI
jgi:hypothetical protein